jgi:histidyl-tRNA synthetase
MMKNIDHIAHQVVATNNVEEKRALVLDVVENFQFKGWKDEVRNSWKRKVNAANARRLDEMILNLAMKATGDGVIG